MNIEINPPTFWEAIEPHLGTLIGCLSAVLLLVALAFLLPYLLKNKLSGESLTVLTILPIVIITFPMGLASLLLVMVPHGALQGWRYETLSSAIEERYGLEVTDKQLSELAKDLVTDSETINSNGDSIHHSLEYLKDKENGWEAREIYGDEKFFVGDSMVDVTLMREGETLKLVYSDGVGSGIPLVELPKA